MFQRSYSLIAWTLIALSALTLIAGACGEEQEGRRVDQVQHARSLWDLRAPSSYVFVYNNHCFCAQDETDAVRVVVEAGQVVAASFATDDLPVPSGRKLTIDGLLEKSAMWAASTAEEFSFEADDSLGYPREVLVDPLRDGQDDEKGFTVRCFALGSAEADCPL
jgi:hypothetical protein